MGFPFLETIRTHPITRPNPFFWGFFGWFDRVFWADSTHVHPYILVVVDMIITSLKNRFKQLEVFESIVGFLFDVQP